MTMGLYSAAEKVIENIKNLPVVRTCYTIRELNEAINNGHHTSIVPVKENPNLCLRGLLLRHKVSGEYVIVNDRKMYVQYRQIKYYPADEWDLIHEVDGYARTRIASSGWGAYILPHEVNPGDRVYIEELIEDVVAFGFWDSVGAAADGEGIWNGRTIEIDHTVYQKFEIIG